MRLCECGCGAPIADTTKRGTPKRFVKGHHFRVLKPTRTHGRSHTRAYRRENDRKNYHAGRTYGLARDEYERLLASTGGVCPVCERELRHPHIDHDHVTGRVRGVLCSECNTGIGKLGDDPDRLRQAIQYLEET